MNYDPTRVPYSSMELLTHPDVTHVECRVWGIIRMKQGNNDSMWHSIANIAKMVHMSRPQVSRAIKRLIELGFLVRDGAHITCVIPTDPYLTGTPKGTQDRTSQVRPRTAQARGACLTGTEGVPERYTNKKKNNNKKNNQEEEQRESAVEFDESPALAQEQVAQAKEVPSVEPLEDAIAIYQRISGGAPVSPLMAPKWKADIGDDLAAWEQACMDWKFNRYAWHMPRLIDSFKRTTSTASRKALNNAKTNDTFRPHNTDYIDHIKREYGNLF